MNVTINYRANYALLNYAFTFIKTLQDDHLLISVVSRDNYIKLYKLYFQNTKFIYLMYIKINVTYEVRECLIIRNE